MIDAIRLCTITRYRCTGVGRGKGFIVAMILGSQLLTKSGTPASSGRSRSPAIRLQNPPF